MSRRGGPSIVVDRAGQYESAPDTGCQYAAKCTACPWNQCVKELPTRQRGEFMAALRLVRSYLAAADSAITE